MLLEMCEICIWANSQRTNKGQGNEVVPEAKGSLLQSVPPWSVDGMFTTGPRSPWQEAAAGEGGGNHGEQQSTDTFEAVDGASLAGEDVDDQTGYETDCAWSLDRAVRDPD